MSGFSGPTELIEQSAEGCWVGFPDLHFAQLSCIFGALPEMVRFCSMFPFLEQAVLGCLAWQHYIPRQESLKHQFRGSTVALLLHSIGESTS